MYLKFFNVIIYQNEFFVYCRYFAQEPTRTFFVHHPFQQFSAHIHTCFIVAASVISHTQLL